ncbi:MAG: tetratricopeptide repeat protein [Prevotella sp.]|jgi:tetratricopeptide (TPR) repeat protein|uniref:Tetratricopeptide repeat protein n=1 Tax=Segatella cerevisiae TaxID=2053716 RepID=A0ABT1BZ69_9BACT|nr:tetratricopeptide repeat protein [Segatella cerevisiae]MCH3994519.1 tetratricopeptide repeat protein [Prevotella sp.]MCI1245860.1 tetratricopeptide repeat protein [Prevotella sp.]MCO6026125.1 tetratricopeptide repeat protein [Segatella cerevisiae]
MKTIKYLVMAALLMMGAGQSAKAQENQQANVEVKNIAKAIEDNKNNPDAVKDQVKDFLKNNKKDPNALVGLGEAYLNINDTANAAKYAHMAISRNKNCGDAYCLLGDLAALKDDGGAAAMWYQNAKSMDPKNPKGYIRYASVYRGRSPEEAVQSLQELKNILPDYPVESEAGHFMYTARKYDKAVLYYSKADSTKLDEDHLKEYALAGYFSGNTAKSLSVSKYGNQRFPRDPVFNRLTFYNALADSDYTTATEYAEKLFTASDSAKIIERDYLNAGHAYLGAKNYQKAIEMYNEAAKLNPQDNDIHKYLSDTYSNENDTEDALKEYNIYTRGKANSTAEDFMALADIYSNAATKTQNAAQKDKYLKEADSIYADIITKFPTYNAYATYMRATLNSNMDPDFKKGLAKPFYEQLITIVKGHTTKGSNDDAYLKAAYYYLGAYYYTVGNKAEGTTNWKNLLELDPNNATAKQALGIK